MFCGNFGDEFFGFFWFNLMTSEIILWYLEDCLTKKYLGLWDLIHVGIPEQSFCLKACCFVSPSCLKNTAGAMEDNELGTEAWKCSFQRANK